MSMPLPPIARPAPKGELTDNEVGFILDSTLSTKHREDKTALRFIESFVRCQSISEASDESGIKPSVGYMYRHRKDIAEAIQKLIERSVSKFGFDGSEIVQRVKEVVDFDPISVYNPDGTFKSNMHDIDPAARRNIKKLEVQNIFVKEKDLNGIEKKIMIGEVIKYEFYDKLKAADMVGAEKEVFKRTTKIEHGVTKDMASILLESARRGAEKSLGYSPTLTVEAEILDSKDE